MYPLNVLSTGVQLSPLFGDLLQGEPHIFDFSSKNPKTLSFDTTNFPLFQKIIFDELDASGKSWGVGRYLEERQNVLRNYPQMISQQRIYHAGLDIIVPEGSTLYAPLDGEIFEVGKEEGIGNYGGYVILKHQQHNESFYSLYGHLHSGHLVQKDDKVIAGQPFARVGGGNDSGGWFTHTHLQILTEEAKLRGRMFHGYVTPDDLMEIEQLFPSPYCLFSY